MWSGSTVAAFAGRLLMVSRLVFDTLHLLDGVAALLEGCDNVFWNPIPMGNPVASQHLGNDLSLRGEIVDIEHAVTLQQLSRVVNTRTEVSAGPGVGPGNDEEKTDYFHESKTWKSIREDPLFGGGSGEPLPNNFANQPRGNKPYSFCATERCVWSGAPDLFRLPQVSKVLLYSLPLATAIRR